MSNVTAETETAKVCPDCKGERTMRILHRGTDEMHAVPCACCESDLPLTFVYQPEAMGCCIAAVAMIVGQPYFEVKQYLNVEHDLTTRGTNLGVVADLLDHYGFAVQTRYRHQPRLEGDRQVWPCEPWADVHFCEVINTRAAGQHAVVLLRDGRVLDPYWGVLQGLHRYPRVVSMTAVFKVGG